MILLRQILSFGATNAEMVHFWIVFCRSVLEPSCVVWHKSLTKENSDDLEWTQKSFVKLVLKNHYSTYEEGLEKLNLDTLSDRREKISLKFAQDGVKFETFTDLLKKKENILQCETRYKNEYEIQFANTERLKKSSVIFLQKLMNQNAAESKK